MCVFVRVSVCVYMCVCVRVRVGVRVRVCTCGNACTTVSSSALIPVAIFNNFRTVKLREKHTECHERDGNISEKLSLSLSKRRSHRNIHERHF